MAFDIQALVEASKCGECANEEQKKNVALYLLNQLVETGGSGGTGVNCLHDLLSVIHPDTLPAAVSRGSLIVGNATPLWSELLIGPGILSSDGVDATWAALTNGQLLIGSTGAAPVAASLTAGANITITPGAGSISIAATGVITQAYSTVQEEGAAVTQRSILNFISAALTAADDAGNSRTNVTLTHSALTKTDDTNVTLTLGGSPSTALLAATSLTLGWTGVLSVARGGSGTSTAFTPGSVIFAGAGGVYTEDNPNFFWDDTNNRLGIGTAAPDEKLHVSGAATGDGAHIGNAFVGVWDSGATFAAFVHNTVKATTGSYALLQESDGGTFLNAATTKTISFRIANAARMTLATGSLSLLPTGVAAGNTFEVRYLELAANGTNYTGFKAADSITNSEIYVLPDAAPSANRFLQGAAVAGGVSVLTWAQIGPGTSTTFTEGSVIFAGAAGVFAEDNPNLFWDDAANRLTVNQLGLPNTTSATVGGIYFGGARVFHDFGTSNIFVGINAGNFTMTGIRNVGIGAGALIANTTGTRNLAIGHNSLISNTEGVNNVGLGSFTLFANTTGVANLAIGASSLASNIDGMLNVAVGVEALTSNVSGLQNVAIGSEALYFTTGSNNVGIGHGALTFNTSGLRNIGIGTNALLLTTGSNNIGFGYQAGNNLTTGSTNIIIGYEIDSPTATNSNTLTLGNLIFGTGLDGTGVTLSSGNIGIGVITPLAKLHVTNSAAATVACIIKAAASQSANLTEWQDSSASVLAFVGSGGTVNSLSVSAASTFGSQTTLLTNTVGSVGPFAVYFSTAATANGTYNNRMIDSIFRPTVNTGVTNSGSQTAHRVDALRNYTLVADGSGTLSFLTGYEINIGHFNTDAVTPITAQVKALSLQMYYKSGTITEFNGLQIMESGGGTATNLFGIRCQIGAAAGHWNLFIDGTANNYFASNVGIGGAPTARLHLPAGTTAASTAPLKLDSGTSMAAAEAGAVEFTTDDLFFTITTGAARKRFLFADATAGLTSGKMPIATTNGRLVDLTASAAYTPTNVTTDRSWDCNATSVDELADALASVVADLQAKGILG